MANPTEEQLRAMQGWAAEVEASQLRPALYLISRRMQRAYRTGGVSGLLQVYNAEIERLRPKRRQIVEAGIRKAAQDAITGFMGEVVATYGSAVSKMLEIPPGSDRPAIIEALGAGAPDAAVRAITQIPDQQGYTYSSRIWKADQQTRLEMERYLQTHLAHGRAAIDGAQELARFQVTDRGLPRHMARLEREARLALRSVPGARDRFLRELKKAKAYAAERVAPPLGTRGFQRTSISRLAKAVRDGSNQAVDEAVDYFVTRRGFYRARVLLRSEVNRAFQQSSLLAYKRQRFVRAVRWMTSTSHGHLDQCDVKAMVNIGMGPGVYYKEEVPWPDHPNGLCHLRPVLFSPRQVGRNARVPVPRDPQAYKQTIEQIKGPMAREADKIGRQTLAMKSDLEKQMQTLVKTAPKVPQK